MPQHKDKHKCIEQKNEQTEVIVRMLLKAGADTKIGPNPVQSAIRAKNYKAVRVLYECGITNPQLSAKIQNSPVMFAL